MNLKNLFGTRKTDPSKENGSYQDSLIRTTRAGTKFTSVFFLAFAIVYAVGEYPRFAMWVNLLAVTLSMAGLYLIEKKGQHRQAAHLVIIAMYISSVGLMIISGGNQSSSAIWQVFVPVAAFIMAGLRAGLRWGVICFITVVASHILAVNGIFDFAGFYPTIEDRFFDLAGAIMAVSIAIWYSDSMKSRSLVQLEETEKKLNIYATIDPLTNIYNRRYFLELSKQIIQNGHSTNKSSSFMLFDLDFFKKINDAYGHIVGDQMLQGVVNICLEHLRADDIFGRFGGEEFVVLLPNTDLEKAKIIAERLRDVIAHKAIETDAGPIKTTISIGIDSISTADAQAIDQLISRSDQAMYFAKQAGRNQTFVWEETISQTTKSNLQRM